MRTWMTFVNGFGIHLLPGWQPVLELPLDERQRALRDPAVRAELKRGADTAPPPFDRLAQFERLEIAETFSPENRDLAGRTVGDVAAARGSDPFETMLDVVVADDLRTGLRPQTRELDAAEWTQKSQVWRDPRTIVGGSDAGAHVEMMCGAVYTTFLLGEAVREHAVLSLEEAVHELTEIPARLYGLRDRGRAVVGAHADLVIFDPDEIGVGATTTRTDLPGGATRLYADARGIHHVLVNGTEIARHGDYTGAAPGTLLRSGRDTDTVMP
jgi:N-acyl-D-aspartate/D-glutamate deacylase